MYRERVQIPMGKREGQKRQKERIRGKKDREGKKERPNERQKVKGIEKRGRENESD